MRQFGATDGIPIDYVTLDVDRAGPTIGYLGGWPIAGTVVDRAGQQYRYAGLVPLHRGFDGLKFSGGSAGPLA